MTLEIRKRTDCVGAELPLACEGGCEPRKDFGPAAGTHVALITGQPAAALCKSCASDWRKWWAEFDAEYLSYAEAA